MITKDNLKNLLIALEFVQSGNQYSKKFADSDAFLKVDFDKNQLIYPEDKGLIINERQTCNLSDNENFVVFECVHRLLEKGYKPEHIELEPKWKLGHGASGGRADILIKDFKNQALLIIECKTFGKEFEKAWKDTQLNGGQLFSYLQQQSSTRFLCLYTSDFKDDLVIHENNIITTTDIKNKVEQYADKDIKPLFYQDANDVKQRYKVWAETYNFDHQTTGIFDPDNEPYNIGALKWTLTTLNVISRYDIQKKYNDFAEVLRKYNVSGKENAFDKLINLFLAKIVDETIHENDLQFHWKGEYFDDYFALQDRLQALYKIGMETYLGEDITYINETMIDEAFWAVKQSPNATKDQIKKYFKQLKFYSNNDFGFIDVHNDKLFYQNAVILLDMIRLWEKIRLTGDQQHQFLGDMFEFFLDKGVKQSEGQFFTPMPICKFMLMSLPLEVIIRDSETIPKAIDYACGAGHFLTELASQIQPMVAQHKTTVDIKEYYKAIYGVEKEYRLSKVAKLSAFMYGQNEINIIYCDALNAIEQKIKNNIITVAEKSCQILVANPPFAVEGFLSTLPEDERKKYALSKTVTDISNNRNIQCFFIERAKQLLAPNGVAAIIVPSSVLSNSDATHIGSREILLKYFDIVALVELGNGTFGKTGTNTVVLFIRRKPQQPEPSDHYYNRVENWFSAWVEELNGNGGEYQDLSVIKNYCQHIDTAFEHYQTLLQGNPSAELLACELFQDYQKDFDHSTETKNVLESHRKQRNGLDKVIYAEINKELKIAKNKFSEVEVKQKVDALLPNRLSELKAKQKQEIKKRFLVYLQKIEKDKLFYFVLCFSNPQKVLIVKSPSDNKEQKQFLGYEWSAAKGNEGIKLTADAQGKHLTPLYDPENRYNPDKINALIQENFSGNAVVISEALQTYASMESLVDLLDFSRKDFDKHVSLSTKKNINLESKWDLVKLDEIATIESGGTPSSTISEYWDGDIYWATLIDTKEKYLTTTQRKITAKGLKNSSAKLLPVDTVIFSSRATIGDVTIAKVETATNQGYKNFICDNTRIRHEYLYYILKYYAEDIASLASGMTFKEISKTTISAFKIPLPPLEIQAEIAKACAIVDAEVEAAKASLELAKTEVSAKLKTVSEQGYPLKKLSNLIEIIGGGTPDTKKSDYWNGGIPWLSVVDFNNGNRFVSSSEKTISESGLKNSSTKYLQVGDLIISARGTVGALAQLAIPMTFNQSCYGLRGLAEVDNGYLYYMLKREVAQFKDNAYGSTFGSITTKTFDSINIHVPPLAVQQSLVLEIEKIETKITAAQKIMDEAASKKQAILKQYL